MTRQTVRTLKRTMRCGLRGSASDSERLNLQESAPALLKRSVDMEHKRLAVIRLEMAARMGVRIPQEHWVYCARMADASSDPTLHVLNRNAAISAVRGLLTASPRALFDRVKRSHKPNWIEPWKKHSGTLI
jgi:hypothetical protein